MWRRKTALAFGVLLVLPGCATSAAVETATTATSRPTLRISLRSTSLLSAFVDRPQFSIQAVTIGDAAVPGATGSVLNPIATF
jgi:hypothetical protein